MTGPAATEPGRGSTRDYCSYWRNDDGHHMVSRSVPEAKQVRWVEICSFCGWIDGVALDGFADNAVKMALTARAQRIAIATDTEPFAFVQRSDEELPLAEIVFQALGAASMCWIPRPSSQEFDSVRAKRVGEALMAEIERSQAEAMDRRERAVREELSS